MYSPVSLLRVQLSGCLPFSVGLIIDFIGADYMSRNINAVGLDGRIVMLAFMSGGMADGVNLAQILSKRITFRGSTLRSRSNEYKADLTQDFQKNFISLFEQQKIRPIIDSVYPWNKVGEAHERIEQNLNIGKIILQFDKTYLYGWLAFLLFCLFCSFKQ